jgi:hypothetical protein
MTSHWGKAHAGLTMPQKLLEAIAVSDMEVAGVTGLGKSLSKNTRKRDEKRKMAAVAEASAAKQARVAEEDAASQAALSGRGQRSARTNWTDLDADALAAEAVLAALAAAAAPQPSLAAHGI